MKSALRLVSRHGRNGYATSPLKPFEVLWPYRAHRPTGRTAKVLIHKITSNLTDMEFSTTTTVSYYNAPNAVHFTRP